MKRFSKKAMPVGMIFISSRMDELTMERQSAFNAVYEAGLTPILFEVEPRDDERKKIDTLVDRADLFLGIFYQSMGVRRDGHLCGRYPIEYEFYRFLTRFLVCPKPESWEIDEDDRERITKKMDDPSYIDDLRKQLRDHCRRESGKLFDLVRLRVRLFLRVHRHDSSLSRMLVEFLDGLPVTKFGNSEDPAPEVISFLEEPRYIPAHVDLFETVFGKISGRLSEGQIRRRDPDTTALLLCKVKGPDQPGLIFAILDVFFNKGLNIKALAIRRLEAEIPAVEVSVLAERFFKILSPEQLSRALSFRFEDMSQIYEVACGEVSAGQKQGDFEVDPGQIPSTQFYYEILTFDVPGIIMLVARLVAHFGGNIEFIHFEDNSADFQNRSHYSSLILAIRPLAADSRIQRDGGITLEYELVSLLGVATVFRRSLAEIRKRFASSPVFAGA